MVTVETIGRIRRAFLVDHKPIRQIVRELRVSRKTVRKAIRGSSTEFRYDLAGMRAAYDEVITAGLRAQHSVQRIIGELLLAQLADNRARSTAYRRGRRSTGRGRR